MKKVFIKKVNFESELEATLNEVLRFLNLTSRLNIDHRILIKPNFTFPYYKQGVTTSPHYIESLVKVLKEFSPKIMLCESDGGYFSWTAEDAFRGHNIDSMVKKYDIKAINLSKAERTSLAVFAKDVEYSISFPKFLKEETDIFISMPVPKVHCMTGVSLAMKNHWGCIPDTMRLSFHHIFNEAILEINKNLPEAYVIADGQFFLDNTGPMYGNPLQKDLIIASDDIGSFDAVLCQLMGMEIDTIPHLRFAKEKGFLPKSLELISFNCELDKFMYKSTLHRSLRNKLMYHCFRSNFLTYLLYTSSFGKMVHKAFYFFRETPDHLRNENLTH